LRKKLKLLLSFSFELKFMTKKRSMFSCLRRAFFRPVLSQKSVLTKIASYLVFWQQLSQDDGIHANRDGRWARERDEWASQACWRINSARAGNCKQQAEAVTKRFCSR
jgi:hypothetical protein